MLPLRLHTVPPPPVPAAEVVRGVCRFAEVTEEESGARALISDARSASGATSVGPDGFSLSHHRLGEGEAVFAPTVNRVRYVAWIVVRGALRTSRGDRLPARSLYLAAPGEAVQFSRARGGDLELLELTYAAPVPFRPRARRIARAADLTPLRSRPPVSWVPTEIGDFLSPRDLYLALGPVASGPLRFRVVGPEKLVAVFVQTPRGTGPALHVHTLTTEMFCVLEGRFRITWGDHGEHEAILAPFDSIVIPKGHNRAFEALDEGENWILPMVVGTNDEREDILWLDHVFEQVRRRLPRLSALASRGVIKVGRRAPR